MAKSKRNRRTGGRTTPRGTGGSLAAQLVGKAYQEAGALGLLIVTAQFAHRCQQRDEAADVDGPSNQRSGEVFVSMLAADKSKLAANTLAAVAQVWPEPSVRAAADAALANRKTQLAGLLRTLDKTTVENCWRVTDEYGDSHVDLFEISLGGRQALTLAAQAYAYQPSWVELVLLGATAHEATDSFECGDQPGNPRRVTRQLTARELRFEAWMLTSKRRVESDHDAAPVVLAWLTRLLDVDVEFPAIPKFDHEIGDELDDDDYVDVREELDNFLHEPAGRPWRADAYDELIDHLLSYEWGERAMRWSPGRVEDFLLFTSYDEVENSHALPALLRSWVGYCAQVHKQRKQLLVAVCADIDRCEPEFFARHNQSADAA